MYSGNNFCALHSFVLIYSSIWYHLPFVGRIDFTISFIQVYWQLILIAFIYFKLAVFCLLFLRDFPWIYNSKLIFFSFNILKILFHCVLTCTAYIFFQQELFFHTYLFPFIYTVSFFPPLIVFKIFPSSLVVFLHALE